MSDFNFFLNKCVSNKDKKKKKSFCQQPFLSGLMTMAQIVKQLSFDNGFSQSG